MRSDSTPSDQPHPDHGGGAGRSGGDVHPSAANARALTSIGALAAGYHQLMRDALATVRRAIDTADIAGLTGLSAATVLQLDHHLPRPVALQLESVATRMDALPDVTAAYAARVIEFDHVADIVRTTRALSGQVLAEVDTWAACRASALARHRLLHRLGDEVAARVEDLRAPGWAHRQERRRREAAQVTGQQDFDGGGRIVADLDRLGYPVVWGSIETVAGPPSPDRPRRHQRADALVAIAEHATAGTGPFIPGPDTALPPTVVPEVLDDGTEGDTHGDVGGENLGRIGHSDDDHRAAVSGHGSVRVARPGRGQVRIPIRPRSQVSVVVDLARATTDRFALLQRITGLRAAPTLSARLTDLLATEAQLIVQLTDGRRPLAELTADDVPDAVRRAVVARDRGCRAPDCVAPARHCDIHHIVRRVDGGTHDPDLLMLLCRSDHRQVDTARWGISLDPATAVVTWTHPTSRRSYRTVPHGTRPVPPRPDHVPLAGWEAPPIPPPPHHAPPDPDPPEQDPEEDPPPPRADRLTDEHRPPPSRDGPPEDP